MSDGAFWFVMVCLIALLDCLSHVQRRREQADYLKLCREYDAASDKRHQDFMAALDARRLEFAGQRTSGQRGQA